MWAMVGVGAVAALVYTAAVVFRWSGSNGHIDWWHVLYGLLELLAGTVFLVLGRRAAAGSGDRRGWFLLSAGYAMLGLGAAASAADLTLPFASLRTLLGNVTWIGSLVAFVAGMTAFPEAAFGRRERRRILLDGLVLAGSAALLLWYIGTRGVPLDSDRPAIGLPGLMRIVLFGDLMLVYALAIALVRTPEGRPRWAFPVMLLAIAGGSLGDVFYAAALAAPTPTPEAGVGNFIWVWSAWLATFAGAAHATGSSTADAASPPRTLVPSRLAPSIAYAAAGLLAVVVIIEAANVAETEFRALAAGAALVAGLLVLRLRMALVENAQLIGARAQQAEQLREAQKLEAIGRLAAGVAHEFNNLLLVIRQGTEAAMEHAAPNERADVKWATDRAATITRQLLAFGRRTDTAPVVFEAAATLQQLQPLLERVVRPPAVLVVQAARAAGTVRMPIGDFEQIVFNLVRNGVEALEGAGAVTVTLMPDAVLPGQLSLRVTDTGRGIAPEARERIFEPFFTTKPVGQGTGLGLAIVYGAVREAGGSVEVESTPGKGTTVLVRLPAHLGAATPAVAAATSGIRVDRPRHILLVDDEAVVRSALLRTLTRMGHQVTVAVDGAEALLRLGDTPSIDIVLTDTVMPGMDGWALIAEIRQRWPRMPIVRMSGYAPAAETHSGEADAFLPKPFEREELARVLAAVLPARRGSSVA